VLENCVNMGEYTLSRLEAFRDKFDFIRNIRGKGLILGMEVERPVGEIVTKCLEEGLLVIGAGENVLRFLPPLTITAAEVDAMTEILERVLGKV